MERKLTLGLAAAAAGALALGSVAAGAVAIGALAIARVAIGKLAIRRVTRKRSVVHRARAASALRLGSPAYGVSVNFLRRQREVESEVERGDRMRQRADRNHVDARRRDLRNGLERHAAGCLDHEPAIDPAYRGLQVRRTEVVEHHRVDVPGRAQHLIQLYEVVDLDLNFDEMPDSFARAR